ncbi:MAG: hypothetical protein ACPGQR_09535, partial [Marinirhabdus sp.]
MRQLEHKPKPVRQVRDSGTFFPKIQAKMKMGEPDDAYEKEANNAAKAVTSNSESAPTLQKMGGPEEEESMQMKSTRGEQLQKMG